MTRPAAGGRRRREIVTLSDGTQRKIAKPPRADVLWYPRYNWPSILVRRTHNLELATDMAHHRWVQIGDDRPLTGTRIGWWTTYAGHTVPDDAAQDQHGRVVRAPTPRPAPRRASSSAPDSTGPTELTSNSAS